MANAEFDGGGFDLAELKAQLRRDELKARAADKVKNDLKGEHVLDELNYLYDREKIAAFVALARTHYKLSERVALHIIERIRCLAASGQTMPLLDGPLLCGKLVLATMASWDDSALVAEAGLAAVAVFARDTDESRRRLGREFAPAAVLAAMRAHPTDGGVLRAGAHAVALLLGDGCASNAALLANEHADDVLRAIPSSLPPMPEHHVHILRDANFFSRRALDQLITTPALGQMSFEEFAVRCRDREEE